MKICLNGSKTRQDTWCTSAYTVSLRLLISPLTWNWCRKSNVLDFMHSFSTIHWTVYGAVFSLNIANLWLWFKLQHGSALQGLNHLHLQKSYSNLLYDSMSKLILISGCYENRCQNRFLWNLRLLIWCRKSNISVFMQPFSVVHWAGYGAF